MPQPKLLAFILHVALPLAGGAVFYLFNIPGSFSKIIADHLPDGLWAYAFISCLMIIWDHRLNWTWLMLAMLVCAGFEGGQYQGWINGTGDWLDLATYLVFGSIAIGVNQFFNARNPGGLLPQITTGSTSNPTLLR